MHYSNSFSKLLILVCVVLMCASFSAARTKKLTRHSSSRSAIASSSTRSHKQSNSVSAHAKTRTRKGRAAAPKVVRSHGQQAINDDRAREIQEALIRARYMDGEPSGTWDARSRDAMTRFQNDNGWQSKVVPDSRALIKLGLGPNHADVINPQTSLMSPSQTGESTSQFEPGGATRQH